MAIKLGIINFYTTTDKTEQNMFIIEKYTSERAIGTAS